MANGHGMSALLRIPLSAIAVSALALVFATSVVAGDALFVAVVFFAGAARAIGPRTAAASRAAMLPLLALLIAPVPMGPHPTRTVALAVLAGAVASAWTLLTAAAARRLQHRQAARHPDGREQSNQRDNHPSRPESAPSPAIAPAQAGRGPNGREQNQPDSGPDGHEPNQPGRGPGGREQTGQADSHPSRPDNGLGPNARSSALEPAQGGRPPDGSERAGQQHTHAGRRPDDREQAGQPDRQTSRRPDDREPAGQPDSQAGRSDGGPDAGGPTPTAARVHVWRGTRAGLSLALAFALGQTLFAQHWTWTVVSAFAIGVGARSRGDAVLKGIQRIAGVCAGTLGATLLSQLVDGRPLLAVLLILAFLGAGLFLREFNYVWWAMAITAVLALLFGLAGQTGGAELLRQRVLAGLLGGACAVVPAVFLAPIRTRALVLKRAGTALRALRAALDAAPRSAEQSAAARRAERDIEALRDAARPLLAIRRLHRRPELDWVDALTGAVPDLKALQADGSGAARTRLVSITKNTAVGVRAAAANRRVTAPPPDRDIRPVAPGSASRPPE